jgi:predicted phosphate transport protein (TIGR00153 family)
LRILPRDEKFYDMFTELAKRLTASATLLHEMFKSPGELEAKVSTIKGLEHEADNLTHDIIDRINRTFVTPFDREDIHELSARLDDVVDFVQAIAETLIVYDVRQPTDEARRLAKILAEQGDELAIALRALRSRKGVTEHLQRVHDLEHEADGLSRAAIARLFREEQNPLDVIKWRDLYGELENGIDAAEDAAEAVERMLHKSS